VIQICLWCVDSGCSKHMTENLKLLINFIWKFMGTVRFGNDHVAAILGFGQFYDSDLEVAFRRDACFVRNLEGVDLLKGDRLPKFKYHKEHLCPSCEQGKSKRVSHPPKPVPNSRQRLHLLHMDLCGPMRISSINGKRYVLVIVDDYSRYTWNDCEDIGKLGAKGDIGFFIRYSADSYAYRVYNRRTKKIMETMNVSFDELSAIAFEQRSSKPELQSMTLDTSVYDSILLMLPTARTVPPAQEPQVRQLSTSSTIIADTVPIPTNSSSLATNILISSQDADELNPNAMVDVIEEPSRPVLTRNQLRSDGDMCMYALSVSSMEPKNVKEAMTDPAWIDSMQKELL
nr:hypothetical protein [Tanacetum cinerariifolium]